MRQLGRNDLCSCGSGKKYKKCCINKDEVYKKFNIMKCYINNSLDIIIDDIKSGHNDTNKIRETAKNILKVVIENGNTFYSEYASWCRENHYIIDKGYMNNILAKDINEMNLTERMVIKQFLQSIILDGANGNSDFGAILVICEAMKDIIFKGLENRQVSTVILNVGYGDKLKSVEIIYGNETYKNIQENTMIYPMWVDE